MYRRCRNGFDGSLPAARVLETRPIVGSAVGYAFNYDLFAPRRWGRIAPFPAGGGGSRFDVSMKKSTKTPCTRRKNLLPFGRDVPSLPNSGAPICSWRSNFSWLFMARAKNLVETERLTVYLPVPLLIALKSYVRDPSRGKALYGSLSAFIEDLLVRELPKITGKGLETFNHDA